MIYPPEINFRSFCLRRIKTAARFPESVNRNRSCFVLDKGSYTTFFIHMQ